MKQLVFLLTVHNGMDAPMDKAGCNTITAAVRGGGVRIHDFYDEGMPFGNDGHARDQLAVREFLCHWRREAYIDLEVRRGVFHDTVPCAIDAGPIDSLTAKAPHVWITAQGGAWLTS